MAEVIRTGSLEVSRAARRAIWQVARSAGTLQATDPRRREIVTTLIRLLHSGAPGLGRQILWMLSEIGSEAGDIQAIAKFLKNAELREEARCALERIPRETSLKTLQAALESVPEDFKFNLAQSLRARGVKVAGYPSRKMIPTRPRKAASLDNADLRRS